MIFHAEEEKPEKGQIVFCELPTENRKTAWLIYHFVNKFPFKVIRWFSVSDIEQAEKRIDFLEEKAQEAKEILANSLNVAGAFLALDDILTKK